MSRPTFLSLVFLLATTSCRMTDRTDVRRALARSHGKVTRAGTTNAVEVFPVAIVEPQPIASVILDQPTTLACLASADEVRDVHFVVDVSGRVTESGKIVGAKVRGVGAGLSRCLEDAASNLILAPGRTGDFSLTLSRQPEGAGAGVIIDPGVSKKYE